MPEEVLQFLMEKLEDSDDEQFKVSKNKWKVNYTKRRTFAGSLDEDDLQTFQEMCKIQIDILDYENDKICVRFSRCVGYSGCEILSSDGHYS